VWFAFVDAALFGFVDYRSRPQLLEGDFEKKFSARSATPEIRPTMLGLPSIDYSTGKGAFRHSGIQAFRHSGIQAFRSGRILHPSAFILSVPRPPGAQRMHP